MFKDKPVIALGIAQTLVWASSFYIFPAMILRLETAFGWSRIEVTGAVSLALFLSAIASPFMGRFLDRGRGPLMMTLTAFLAALLLALVPFVETLWQFYLLSALMGTMWAGCLYDPCFALVTRARGREAKSGIVRITLMAGFASTISFPASYYLSENFSWQICLWVFAAVVIFVTCPLMAWGASRMEKEERSEETSAAETVKEKAFIKLPYFWFLAFAFACISLLHGTTIHHFLPILSEKQVSAEQAILLASLIGPMQVAGRIVMVMVEKRVSNHGVALACFVSIGFAILVLSSAGNAFLLLALSVAFFGAAYGVVSIIRPLLAREVLGGANFGAKTGMLALVYLVGSGSAPFLGSLIWNLGGYDLVLASMMGLAAVGLLLYWLARRSAAQPS